MQKQILTAVIVLVFLVVGLSGCIKDNVKEDLVYENLEYGLSIKVPTGWKVNDASNEYGCYAELQGPIVEDIRTSIIIGSYTLDDEDTFISECHYTVELYLNDPYKTVYFHNETTVNGIDAYEIVYLWYDIKYKSIMIERNQTMFYFDYCSLETTYDNYLNDFNESMNSLVLR